MERNYELFIGDVALVTEGGWGFCPEDEGRYVEVVGFERLDGDPGVIVKPYNDTKLHTNPGADDTWMCGYESFGDNPLILLNTKDEQDGEEGDEKDMVNKPSHYQLFHKDEIEGDFIEVKHVVKAVLERWQEQDKISFDFYQAGCYKELLQYLLRAPLKNNIEDVQKAEYYLKEIINEW